jgi:hypothetical protein
MPNKALHYDWGSRRALQWVFTSVRAFASEVLASPHSAKLEVLRCVNAKGVSQMNPTRSVAT